MSPEDGVKMRWSWWVGNPRFGVHYSMVGLEGS